MTEDIVFGKSHLDNMALNSENGVFHKINMRIVSNSVYIHMGLSDIKL